MQEIKRSNKSDWNGHKVYHLWNKRQEGTCVGYPQFAIEVNGELRLTTHEEVLEIMQMRLDSKFKAGKALKDRVKK